MTYLHLAYLQQLSQLLGHQHKNLAGRLGYIAKKISQKHVVHTNGADLPKLFLCKACQTPVDVRDVQSKGKKTILKCPSCGFKRSYSNSRVRPNKKASKKKNKTTKDSHDKQQQQQQPEQII